MDLKKFLGGVVKPRNEEPISQAQPMQTQDVPVIRSESELEAAGYFECEKTLFDFSEEAETLLNAVMQQGENISYTDILQVYEDSLIKFAENGEIVLIEITREFIICAHNNMPFFELSDTIVKKILAAMYLASVSFNVSYENVIEYLIDNLYGCKDEDDNVFAMKFPFCFEDFSLVLDATKEYSYSVEDAQQTVNNIWHTYFEKFLEYASEDSLKTLKNAEEEWQLEDWGKVFYDFYSKQESFLYDSSELAIYIGKYYPELISCVYKATLINKLNLFFAEECTSSGEYLEANEDLVNFMELMADYAKYRSEEFDLYSSWKWIIDSIMQEFNGNTLYAISKLLCEYFNICEEEVNSFICRNTLAILYEDYSFETGDFKSLYCPRTISERINRIISLLADPNVYKVVAEENYALIQAFDYHI